DLLKGLAPTAAAGLILHCASQGAPSRTDFLLWLVVGAGAIVGHMFSLFLKFKGGKGVATSAGVVLGVFPYYTLPVLIATSIWLVLFKLTGYVSVASIAGSIGFPIAYAFIAAAVGWPFLGDQLPLLIFAILIPA